ncbi:MAG: adenylosuccinate synthetase, partial [Candidatus Sumerlaeaceae bacterium]|nr:adenylosuccinate synthetase [Candidatus Sumerlaeaceae bacterium]
YEINGKAVDILPFGLESTEGVTPIYRTFKGWRQPLDAVRKFEDLPREAQEYVLGLEEMIGARMDFVSVGPDREETIFRSTELFHGL